MATRHDQAEPRPAQERPEDLFRTALEWIRDDGAQFGGSYSAGIAADVLQKAAAGAPQPAEKPKKSPNPPPARSLTIEDVSPAFVKCLATVAAHRGAGLRRFVLEALINFMTWDLKYDELNGPGLMSDGLPRTVETRLRAADALWDLAIGRMTGWERLRAAVSSVGERALTAPTKRLAFEIQVDRAAELAAYAKAQGRTVDEQLRHLVDVVLGHYPVPMSGQKQDAWDTHQWCPNAAWGYTFQSPLLRPGAWLNPWERPISGRG